MDQRDPSSEPRHLEVMARIARIATEDLALRPMLQRVTDALGALFDWEFVALVRVDRATRRFVCEAVTSRVATAVGVGYSRAFDSGAVGHVAATGVPLLLDDTSEFPGFVDTLDGARSELCVPIRHRGEVVAMLNLESPRPAAFHGQLPLVEAIAGQIAGAIASARRHEEVRRSADSLGALSEVSRTALEGEDLDLVLERIASYVQRRFDFFLVAIVVADEGMREWSHRAFALREPLELIAPSRWPIARGVVGRALRSGEAQLVLDVGSDPDYFAVHERVVAEFAAPIRWRGRILGAVNVESDSRDAFPRETRELIEAVATQVAGAIRFALVNWKLEETKRQLERANAELERLSLVDALTGIANRRRFDVALELEWRRLARTGRPLSLALLDIDCFKAYNDALGHIEGDRCLARVGELLRAAVQRAGDLVARYGGEEFAILLTETGAEEANALADRLRAELAELALPHPASAVAPCVTASLGVATRVPIQGGTAIELVAAADSALYAAKRAGRNRVVAAAPG